VSTSRTAAILAPLAVTALVLSACGGADDDASADPPPTTSASSTSDWREEVAAQCSAGGADVAAIQPNDGTAAGIAAEATATKAVFDGGWFSSLEVPADVQPTLDQIVALGDEAREYLEVSIESAEAGDTDAAQQALDEGFDRLARTSTAWAMAGARCGPADPARVENADLTIPLEMEPWQIAAGFDSIWVSEQLAGRVVRLDPDTGEIQATIDIGDAPFKLQPADGSMWVRTASSYVAVDPATNEVTATLTKADVGPSANRSWAVDGAMWICDGRRLHRYDPTTLTADATLDLDLDCGSVWASDDLVAAWSYNEDPGESATSAAAFVDPATNEVLATVALPVDVGGPAVLADSVFFPGYGGSKPVVVDPATWTATTAPDLGTTTGGSGQPAAGSDAIYIGTANHQDVLRVDPTTLEATDTIEPLGVNALLIDDGALWVATGQPYDTVQRFDLD
jgi:hypothetical protein